jgi:ATPase subunit of ABC transporter with duplicated ATPase domains
MKLTLRKVILGELIGDVESHAWRADVILDTFDAPEDLRRRPVSQLSGGWQRLAQTGRAWVSEPDVLIIDDPTNHLDLTKILLLEEWLNGEVGRTALLLVSHDRRFLERSTNRTLFLRPGQCHLFDYPFLRARELLRERDRTLENQRDRELDELDRLRRGTHSLRQTGANNYSVTTLRKSTQIVKRAVAVEDALPQTHVEVRRDVRLATRETHAKRIVGIRDVTIRRPDGVALFHIGRLEVRTGDRLALLGRSGTGKTRFVCRLKKAFDNPEGARAEGIEIAPSVSVGYVDQQMSDLTDTDTPHGYISGILTSGSRRAVSVLVAAGFPLAQHSMRIGTKPRAEGATSIGRAASPRAKLLLDG